MADSLTIVEYLRSVLAILVFFILLLACIPIALILLVLTAGGASNFIVENFGPAIGRSVLFTLGIKFKVVQHGLPQAPPVIYTVNHSSTLDLITMIALGLPHVRFVAKWELQYNPLIFIIGRLTGQIFIQRDNREQAVPALQKTYARIKKDKLSIMVAPEGSRKHEGIIGPFKKGAFRMAIDLGVPIVPIYFDGNQKLSLGGSLFAKSGTITAHIHSLIETENWSLETIETHIEEVRDLYLRWAGVE